MKLLQYVVRSMDQNVYIYFDEESKEGVIVDPGNDAARIAQVIKENEIDVKAILLTHGHGDHTGAVADLKAELGCPVGAHRWELPVLEDERISFSAMYGAKKFDVDMIFEDGDEFRFGGTSLKVIHTPGHTQGGVCFYDEANKIHMEISTSAKTNFSATLVFDKVFDRLKGFLTDHMLNLAGILSRGFFVHTQHHKEFAEGCVAVINLPGSDRALVCEGDVAVFVHKNVVFIF